MHQLFIIEKRQKICGKAREKKEKQNLTECRKNYYKRLRKPLSCLHPIQDGPFRDCSWMGSKKAHLPKICHTHPIMMKLGTVIPYLMKIQKIYELGDTHFEFC